MQGKRNGLPPQLLDRDWLHDRYVERGMTMKEIAGEVGCVRASVFNAMQRLGIQSRGRTGPPPVAEIGQRFGSLVVIEDLGTMATPNGKALRAYRCRCDCGTETITRGARLTAGTSSCRACVNRTHGQTGTPTFGSWLSMVRRCSDPGHIGFKYWGGRGITVCAQWDDFAVFLADMGERPEGMTLDRIDVDGNYEPGNVRWATPKQQANNRRPASPRH